MNLHCLFLCYSSKGQFSDSFFCFIFLDLYKLIKNKASDRFFSRKNFNRRWIFPDICKSLSLPKPYPGNKPRSFISSEESNVIVNEKIIQRCFDDMKQKKEENQAIKECDQQKKDDDLNVASMDIGNLNESTGNNDTHNYDDHKDDFDMPNQNCLDDETVEEQIIFDTHDDHISLAFDENSCPSESVGVVSLSSDDTSTLSKASNDSVSNEVSHVSDTTSDRSLSLTTEINLSETDLANVTQITFENGTNETEGDDLVNIEPDESLSVLSSTSSSPIISNTSNNDASTTDNITLNESITKNESSDLGSMRNSDDQFSFSSFEQIKELNSLSNNCDIDFNDRSKYSSDEKSISVCSFENLSANAESLSLIDKDEENDDEWDTMDDEFEFAC